MAVVPRKRKGKTVYGVLTSYGEGRTSWKLVGSNKREAEEYDRACRKAVKAGTYKPEGELTADASFETYSRQWHSKRTNRAAENEWTFVRIHVLGDKKRGTEGKPWFSKKRMGDFRPKHFIQLAKELTEAGKLSDKSISNLMGVLSVVFRDATIEEVISVNPYIMPRGVLKRSGEKREPYSVEEARLLMAPEAGLPQFVWNAIAFYTGARCGEVCGLRWKDWNEAPALLGALSVERQYDGLVLKTERPRVVPVHPSLASVLRGWRKLWAVIYLYQPDPEDFIVPQQDGTARTRHGAYKAWRRGCDAVGVTNRSVHSTRHTFITLTLRGGADRRIVERITHNPKGDIVDVYTSHDWRQFCDAVLCLNLDAVLDGDSGPGNVTGSDSRTRTLGSVQETATTGEWREITDADGAALFGESALSDPVLDARLESVATAVRLREPTPSRTPPGGSPLLDQQPVLDARLNPGQSLAWLKMGRVAL